MEVRGFPATATRFPWRRRAHVLHARSAANRPRRYSSGSLVRPAAGLPFVEVSFPNDELKERRSPHMFRVTSIVLLASLCSLATAQADKKMREPAANGTVNETKEQASLDVKVLDAGLLAIVHGSEAGFWGVFGLSLTSNLAKFDGLPPLLADAVVMGFGFTDTNDLEMKVPLSAKPAEAIFVYGQALIIDEHGYFSSGIVPVVIGGKNGEMPKPAIN
jgi:hypothetical protein